MPLILVCKSVTIEISSKDNVYRRIFIMYEMKPEYYTGIEAIDQEHGKLFSLAGETHELLNDNLLVDKTEKLNSLISELIDYTRIHFSHEEAYLEQIHYDRIAEHAALHRSFEESLMQFDLDDMGEDGESQNAFVEDLLGFLITWLINHIQRTDMQYVSYKG